MPNIDVHGFVLFLFPSIFRFLFQADFLFHFASFRIQVMCERLFWKKRFGERERIEEVSFCPSFSHSHTLLYLSPFLILFRIHFCRIISPSLLRIFSGPFHKKPYAFGEFSFSSKSILLQSGCFSHQTNFIWTANLWKISLASPVKFLSILGRISWSFIFS